LLNEFAGNHNYFLFVLFSVEKIRNFLNFTLTKNFLAKLFSFFFYFYHFFPFFFLFPLYCSCSSLNPNQFLKISQKFYSATDILTSQQTKVGFGWKKLPKGNPNSRLAPTRKRWLRMEINKRPDAKGPSKAQTIKIL